MTTIQNNQPFQPSVLVEERCCDLCSKKHDVIDLIESPDKNGYFCKDCITDGDVSSYLSRIFKYKKGTITKFLNSITL